MGGRYQLFVPDDALLLALDDDGGCSIIDYWQSHGEAEAVALFREWVLDEIRARSIAESIRLRRHQFKVIPNVRG